MELDDSNSRNWTYQQGIGGMMVGYTGTPITDTDIEKVVSVKGIRDYNGVGDGSVFSSQVLITYRICAVSVGVRS